MPNSDYLITQRKMKRIKNEATYLTSNGTSDFTMMSMNPVVNNTNNPNQSMYAMNAYSTQNGYPNDPNNLNYYNNSYYDWSTNSNFNYQNGTQQMISHNFTQSVGNNSSASNNSVANSIEDSLETSIRDIIKIFHQAYQVYLSPLVQSLKEELNTNSNHYNYQHRLNQSQNQYPTTCQTNIFDRKNLHEIIDHLRFYARKFANFSENIPGI